MYFNYVLCLVAQSCLTLCNSKDSSRPDSSVHGISQARILEWVPFPSLRDLPDPGIRSRDPTWVSCFAGRFFTAWATRETLSYLKLKTILCGFLTVVTSLGGYFEDERTLVNLLIYCPFQERAQMTGSKYNKMQLQFIESCQFSMFKVSLVLYCFDL